MKGLEKYQKIGADYIVEVEGNEAIKTRQPYFVCLLCHLTENIAQLSYHLSSEAHCINFIVSMKALFVIKNVHFLTFLGKTFSVDISSRQS